MYTCIQICVHLGYVHIIYAHIIYVHIIYVCFMYVCTSVSIERVVSLSHVHADRYTYMCTCR